MTVTQFLGGVSRFSYLRLRRQASPPLSRPVRKAGVSAADWLACLGAGVALITAGAPAPLVAQTQTTRYVLAAIAEHLRGLPRENRPFQRYFTLTNLHKLRTVTDEDLLRHRAALSKLVNSLSWKREILVPQPVDAQQAVLAIDLYRLGWDRELWQR